MPKLLRRLSTRWLEMFSQDENIVFNFHQYGVECIHPIGWTILRLPQKGNLKLKKVYNRCYYILNNHKWVR